MKTIDEGAKEIEKVVNGKLSTAFRKGVEFAQRRIPVEEELPVTYESGNWDGLRGSFVIVYDSFGEWHKARPYSGFLDGHNFYDWYSESDCMLSNITHWRPVERS